MPGKLTVTSPCFQNEGPIPVDCTGYGADRSPELVLSHLEEGAQSLVVIMDDMGHPIPSYNHWVIWNIPAWPVIPGGVPPGKIVESLGDAIQGRAYGRHRYRGPKPPFRWSHRYEYRVYVLDCRLQLPLKSRKSRVLRAMEGHILQRGTLAGHYR